MTDATKAAIERVRDALEAGANVGVLVDDLWFMIAELDRLARENERLVEVLRTTIEWADRHGKEPDWLYFARVALGEPEGGTE